MDDVEKTIAAITRLLSVKNETSIENGLNQLQTLLMAMLPQIEQQKQLVTKTARLGKFLRLQDNFKYNIAWRLQQCLGFLFDHINDIPLNMVITFTRLFQGILLLHENSRCIFTDDEEMNKVLRFIELDNDECGFEITIGFISLLVHILLKNYDNFRTFERCGGCSVVIRKLNLEDFQLVKSESRTINQQTLNFKIIEFLIFYFTEESGDVKRTVHQKAELFKPEFPGINTLIESLNDLHTLL